MICVFFSWLAWPSVLQLPHLSLSAAPLWPCWFGLVFFIPAPASVCRDHSYWSITVSPPTDIIGVPQMTSYSYLTPSSGTSRE